MKRKITGKFQIDGVPMLSPDGGVGVEFKDLISSDSGRDESGYTHNSVIRSEMRSWKFNYTWLTAEEFQYVRSLMRGKHEFDFTFVNEFEEVHTIRAYCQQKSAAYWSNIRGIYKDLQFEIIEC